MNSIMVDNNAGLAVIGTAMTLTRIHHISKGVDNRMITRIENGITIIKADEGRYLVKGDAY